jgi:predicted O-linked N-acetylglucosamine transferase (SPINDLY family)
MDSIAAFHEGLALYGAGRVADAAARFERAVALDASLVDAYINLSAVLVDLNRPGDAVAAADRAIALDPGRAMAYRNRGAACDELGRADETIADFGKALALDPHSELIASRRLFLLLENARWDGLDAEVARLTQRVDAGEFAANPFELLAVSASAAQHRKAGETFRQRKLAAAAPSWPRQSKAGKIRVGYFSPDFRPHAVAHLTAALFEVHDRTDFEILGFNLGRQSDDRMSRRLSSAFDRFVDLTGVDDAAAAGLAREMKIDIAVDLAGYTNGARPNIFAHRAAPVQVSYLGYPGTMGLEAMDYLIADRVLIPSHHRRHYAEKIAWLPCYQVNDWRRVRPDAALSRAACGLPQDAFVFCGFNNSYKITPQVFDVWMDLLRQVPGSVLWLRAGTLHMMTNLRKEAERRGIPGDRLIFAAWAAMAEHIARHGAADLFLDTFTYNAHTTASDALWAGLPVVTLCGDTFPSRVTASLLTAIDLPDLIAPTVEQYAALALDLAAHPDRLAAVKARLLANRQETPLFDTVRFACNIETAYRKMIERHDAYGVPADFEVTDAYAS